MDKEKIGQLVDSWIDEEDMPVRANLKPIRKYDIYSDMDEDEYEAYRDFMYWYLTKDHAALMSLPATEETFWTIELDEAGNNVSAFNTHDFEKLHPFNKYLSLAKIKSAAFMSNSRAFQPSNLMQPV